MPEQNTDKPNHKRERRIQIFPRSSVYEILSGMAVEKQEINKDGKPMQQRVLNDILETYCYTTLKEGQRDYYRDLFRIHKKNINENQI